MTVSWRIYYDNGSTFSSKDGSFKDAPAWGVLAVSCDPDLWRSGDMFGLIEFLQRTGLVKFGKLVDNETYDAVLKKARADQDLASNRYILERSDFYWFEGDHGN